MRSRLTRGGAVRESLDQRGTPWVRDRGCGTDGTYLYGNTRDVPYKMDRVRWSSHRGEPVWEDRRAA